MALALAPEPRLRLGSVYERAGQKLEIAKSTDKDCFFLLGRTLEWKQLSDAAELKDELTRMVRSLASRHNTSGNCVAFIEKPSDGAGQRKRVERPWRFPSPAQSHSGQFAVA